MSQPDPSGSALRGVFGSTASLAELSGDVNPDEKAPSGYSRFGLNERPPTHQMHTTVPRRTSISGVHPLKPRQATRWKVIAALFAFGVLQGRLLNFHLPPGSSDLFSALQLNSLLAVSGVIAVVIGLLIPSTDRRQPELPKSPSLGGAPSKAALEQTSDTWYSSLIRSYGVLLGLVYLSHKLPREAILAWVLINPTMWYIADRTSNGFWIASSVSILGTALTAWQFPQLWNASSGAGDLLLALAGTATAYFGTSLVAGNVGRGLHKGE